VILDTFTLLVVVPVHEEPVSRVYHHDGYHHVHRNAEGGDTAEQS
jgi:hypothetical protein